MKKTIRWMLVVSCFVFMVISFSALSCSITPGPTGFTVTIDNGGLGAISVSVNGGNGITFLNPGSLSVPPNATIQVYSQTLGYTLLFSPTWSNTYYVNTNVALNVVWNMFDGWHVFPATI